MNANPYGWKPKLYLTAKYTAWIYAALVGLGMVDMFLTYSRPGQGISSPWGQLTPLALVTNIVTWAGPAIGFLGLIHRPAIRNWFCKDLRSS